MSTSASSEAGAASPAGGRRLPEDSEWQRLVQEQIREHPYRTLAIAAGVGFVLGGGMLGGGLLTRASARLLVAGVRLGAAAVAAPMATRIAGQVRGVRARRDAQ